MKRTLVSTVVLAATMSGTAVAGGLIDSGKAAGARLAVGTEKLAVGTLDFLHKAESSRIYLGIQLFNGDLDGVDELGQDMSVLNATFGYKIGRGLAVEARFGAGSDQLDTVAQDPVSSYAASLVRYQYTWDNNIMAYAGVGVGLRNHSRVLGINENQLGGALAFGVNLFGNDNSAINIEYFTVDGPDRYSAIGIGFHHYFGRR